MPGALDAGSIRKVLSGPAVRRTFTFALVGRLAYGLLPLCFLFTIRDASDSFAVAATAVAAYGFASLAMPLQARFVDRYGQRRVLPCYTACFVTVLLVLAFLSRGNHPDALWVALGLLLGLAAPALGPAMRAQWREITAHGAARRIAYSVDSVGEESLYLIGPLGASMLLAIGHPEAGLLVAAGFTFIGTAALTFSPYAPSPGPRTSEPISGSTVSMLRQQEFRNLLLAMVLFGSAGAACFVGVAALADRADRASAVGIIEAAMAVGAILAGLSWARLGREASWRSALLALLLVLVVAQAGAALAAPHLALVGAFLVVTGAVAAPIFVVAFTAADTLVLPGQRTEASTWVTTSINAGNSGGTALAGLLAVGNAAPFLVAVSMTIGALPVIWASRKS